MATLALTFGAAVLVAACGEESTEEVASLADGGTEAAAADAGQAEEEVVAFVECMRDEGFDLPDPVVDADGNVSLGDGQGGGPGGGPGGQGGGGALGGSPEELGEATETCGGLPDGLTAGISDEDVTSLQDAALEFAQCLRDGGLDVDDPDFSGFGEGGGGQGQGGGPLGDLDLDDPEVVAVVEECQALLADAGFPGGGNG